MISYPQVLDSGSFQEVSSFRFQDSRAIGEHELNELNE